MLVVLSATYQQGTHKRPGAVIRRSALACPCQSTIDHLRAPPVYIRDSSRLANHYMGRGAALAHRAHAPYGPSA